MYFYTNLSALPESRYIGKKCYWFLGKKTQVLRITIPFLGLKSIWKL